MLNELAKQVHENAKQKGFFDNPKNIGELCGWIWAFAYVMLAVSAFYELINLKIIII